MIRNNADETKRGFCFTSVYSAYKKQDTPEFPVQKGIKRFCLLPLVSSSSSLAKEKKQSNLSHQSQQIPLFIHIVPPTIQQQRHRLVRNRTTASNTPFIFLAILPHTVERSLSATYLEYLSISSIHYRILVARNLSHTSSITSAHYRTLSTRKRSKTSRQKHITKDHTHSSQHPR